MADHYVTLKTLHLTAVSLSLCWFALRWMGVLAQSAWPMGRLARYTSVAVDVVLLCAGVTLWWVGGWNLLDSPWLATKLALLLVYIVLGSWALKRARHWRGRLGFGLAALGVALWMVGVALAHHPMGWLAR